VQKYKIEIKPLAEDDLETIFLFIAQDSPANAFRWYQHLVTKIQSLETMPKRCPIAPESKDVAQEIRHFIIDNYRALFTIDGKTVQVLHVRGGWQERKL